MKNNKMIKFCLALMFALSSMVVVHANDQASQAIIYENGMHYIPNPYDPDEKLTLFCMNNKRHWPHHTSDMGTTEVPQYVEGYLTVDDFKSQEDYDQCMYRLSKLLYAGYPYNGARLYKIVESEDLYIPTIEEFNEMLIVDAQIQEAFPYLGHHAFSYDDWLNQNQEHLDLLSRFILDVGKLYPNHLTKSGVTYEDMTADPFYKAVLCLLNATEKDNPLEVFAQFYPESYFVTEEQAYNATQKAVWRLLDSYGIEDNDIGHLNDTQLGQTLYTYSNRVGLLNYEPRKEDIHLTGFLQFTYHPEDQLWYSGELKIEEPSDYNGIYYLNLPEGMKAICDNLSYVYGNESYQLVSDHEPTPQETFTITSTFTWLQDFKQYTPTPNIEVNGKKFQHMVGAIIKNKTLTAHVPVAVQSTGDLSITKEVLGGTSSKAFNFELKLTNQPTLNGIYGDFTFKDGVAAFTLKDQETKVASHLPNGTHFEVREIVDEEYYNDTPIKSGQIKPNEHIQIMFTNVRRPDLTISQKILGNGADTSKTYTVELMLRDGKSNPINDTYENISFVDGKGSFRLGHQESITFKHLPPHTSYQLSIKEANEDSYTTLISSKEGTIIEDTTLFITHEKKINPATGIEETSTLPYLLAITGCVALALGYSVVLKKRQNSH